LCPFYPELGSRGGNRGLKQQSGTAIAERFAALADLRDAGLIRRVVRHLGKDLGRASPQAEGWRVVKKVSLSPASAPEAPRLPDMG
jgi:hypothetical protein